MPVVFYLSVCGVLVAISGSTEVQCVVKPYGVRMCQELCSSRGLCSYPQFVKAELSCSLPVTKGRAERSNDNTRVPSRTILSKSKGKVVITKTVSRDYKTSKARKDILFIKFHRDKKSWPKAQKACKSHGGRLVKADTVDKVEALQKFATFKDKMKKVYFWIGLRDVKDNDSFYWTDGSPMGINRWGPREPMHITINRKGERLKENCVAVQSLFSKGFLFNDMRCTKRNSYICERTMSLCA